MRGTIDNSGESDPMHTTAEKRKASWSERNVAQWNRFASALHRTYLSRLGRRARFARFAAIVRDDIVVRVAVRVAAIQYADTAFGRCRYRCIVDDCRIRFIVVRNVDLFQFRLSIDGLQSLLLYVTVGRLPHVVVFNDVFQRFPRQLNAGEIQANFMRSFPA